MVEVAVVAVGAQQLASDNVSGGMWLQFERAPWGDIFGMLTDGFGVSWLVNITSPKP